MSNVMPEQDFSVKDIQAELLSLLKWFHRLCAENNIHYSLHGGTLLGAIREKGFIPWDDDVDISMTRDNYEKLCRAMEKNDDEGIQFDIIEKIPKIVYREKGHVTVWADIFIWDYITENRILQKCKVYIALFIGAMLKVKKTLVGTKINAKEYGRLKYVLFYCAYLFGRLFLDDTKKRWLERFSQKAFCGSRKLIFRSNDRYCGIVLILPKQVMENYILTPFEDIELMISDKYHDILVSSYGEDYMIPKKFGENAEIFHKNARDNLNT